MGKCHKAMKSWFTKLFRKWKTPAKSEEDGCLNKVPENDEQVMRVPHNTAVELPLEQQQMMENLQMIEQLTRLVEMDHQQTCQISNNQRTFECKTINLDTKIQNFELMLQENKEKDQKQIQSLLLQIQLLLDHMSYEDVCHQNKENTDTVEKLKKNLLLMGEKLQEMQQNDNQDILKKQIKVLLQRLNVKDKQISEITAKNEGLSEDLKHLLITSLDMQHQLMRQGQRHEEDQKKNDDTCRQVEMISQRLIAKDQQIVEITAKNEVLSEDLKNVLNTLSNVKLQLQQHEEEQKKKNIETCRQVEILSQRVSAKDKQISEISAKNEVLSEDLKNVWSKFSEMQLQLQVQLQRLEEEQKKNFDCCQQVELLSQQLKTKECQWEQQLQEQRQRQEPQDDEHQKEVKQHEMNRQYEERCWEAEQANVELKKTMDQLNMRMHQLEEKKEQHQDEPCSQLRFERQRPKKPNTSQNTQYRCQPQRKKRLEQRQQQPQQEPRSQIPSEREKQQKQQTRQENLQQHQLQRNKQTQQEWLHQEQLKLLKRKKEDEKQEDEKQEDEKQEDEKQEDEKQEDDNNDDILPSSSCNSPVVV